MNQNTEDLTEIIEKINSSHLQHFFHKYKRSIYSSPDSFSDYIRNTIKKHGTTQQVVFLKADISEGYGYKLISGEKHTKKRDLILRICIVADFSLRETNRTLKLYNMSPLYVKIKRDVILIKAIQENCTEIEKINELLKEFNFPPLDGCALQD